MTSHPTLTIMIPTLNNDTRKQFLARLLSILNPQIHNYSDRVKLNIISDNREMTTGEKRNKLIETSTTDYVCFIDDDDKVADTYVSDILNALDNNPNTDCVVFESYVTQHGKFLLLGQYGFPPNYERLPCHVHVWKREIANKHKFPNITRGEDFKWLEQACKDIKHLSRVDKPLYFYESVPGKQY